MNNERAYCEPDFRRYLTVENIVRLSIMAETQLLNGLPDGICPDRVRYRGEPRYRQSMSLISFSLNIQTGCLLQLTRPGTQSDSTMETARLNPFRIESPGKLLPRELVDLFVERYTQVGTVKQRKHTIIWRFSADPAKACPSLP